MSRTRFQSSSAESSRPSLSLVVRARRVRICTRSSSLEAMSNSRSSTSTSLAQSPDALVEIRERVQRLRIFAPEVEDGLPRLDRLLRLAELVGREMRDLRADLGLRRVARGVLELALVNRVELLPRALLLVDPRQRGDRAIVRLVEIVEDATIGADGVRRDRRGDIS